MNSSRNLLQCNSPLRQILASLIHKRTFSLVQLQPCTVKGYDLGCRATLPLKISPSITWTMCNYAKKAGKDKKGKPIKHAKVELTQEDIGDIISLDKVKKEMQETVDRLKENYIQQLNLRSNMGSFENIMVDTADGKFHLNELGQIVQKNPQLLMINLAAVPQYIKEVKKALDNSGMNLNAQQEGTTIFIPIPKVTREHRENLAKNAKVHFENTKTHLTHLNTKFTKKVNSVKAKHSEDLIRNINNMLVDLTHEYTSEAEKLLEKKKQELLG